MESTSLAILVIDANRIRASIIEAGLRETGHDNVTVVHDITGIAQTIASINPDVIVIDLGNPNRDMLENMFQLSRAVKRPIAMFVDSADRASIEAAVEAGVSAYVVNGLKQERVKPILDMAISRFNAFSRLSRELEEVSCHLEGQPGKGAGRASAMGGSSMPVTFHAPRFSAASSGCPPTVASNYTVGAAPGVSGVKIGSVID
jgi:response regulator NasT